MKQNRKCVIYEGDGDKNEGQVPICRRVAEEKGVPVIDVHSAFEGKNELFIDGCHPNAKGASLIAETIHAAADRQ